MPLLPLHITHVNTFQDNYVWIVSNQTTKTCLIADPGDAKPVLHWLIENNSKPVGILLTHHHWDHAGGVEAIKDKYNIPVYGSLLKKETVITHVVEENEILTFDDFNIRFRVILSPGHTIDHVLFFSPDKKWLFCGDTLFSAGCGRLFEGKAAQLYQSLQKIAALPEDTEIYCAHEYTLKNLQFALFVEPHNSAILEHIEKTQRLLESGKPSLPSSLALEKQINPFLRCHVKTVMNAVCEKYDCKTDDPVEIFRLLREWKDNF